MICVLSLVSIRNDSIKIRYKKNRCKMFWGIFKWGFSQPLLKTIVKPAIAYNDSVGVCPTPSGNKKIFLDLNHEADYRFIKKNKNRINRNGPAEENCGDVRNAQG
jgi:hypothetical protein